MDNGKIAALAEKVAKGNDAKQLVDRYVYSAKEKKKLERWKISPTTFTDKKDCQQIQHGS